MKVKVVTAYVELNLQKRPAEDFHVLGSRLCNACGDKVHVFRDFPFEQCWLAKELDGCSLPAANERAQDRFATDEEHVRSNILQHSPVQWVWSAAAEDPSVDVWVWMGYSLLKQGDFTGKRITEDHVSVFLDKVGKYPFDDIPFPGIEQTKDVLPHGNNWRFCGSTVIIPTKYLRHIYNSYKFECRRFIMKHRCVPLDLAIWPEVERYRGLPWQWYQAEYDYTQLTNFPG